MAARAWDRGEQQRRVLRVAVLCQHRKRPAVHHPVPAPLRDQTTSWIPTERVSQYKHTRLVSEPTGCLLTSDF